MASEGWYYSKNDEKIGPISSAELKKIASEGQLLPTDLVWREGMEDWKPASNIKGLFTQPVASSGPPPVPKAPIKHQKESIPEKTGINVTALAKKQAERTKLKTVKLPALYSAIGKQILGDKSMKEEFPEFFKDANQIKSQIAGLKKRVEEREAGENFSDKAKSLALTAKDQTEIQARKVQGSRLATKVGKYAFANKRELADPSMVANVEENLQRIDVLNGEIEALSKSAGGLLRNVLVVISLVGCFPIGFFLIWWHPKWDQQQKWKWTKVAAAALGCVFVLGVFSERQTAKRIAEANSQWESGDKDSAIISYRQLVEYGPSSIPKEERSIIYGRLIEYDISHGREQSARKLAEEAAYYRIEPEAISYEAKRLMAEVRQARKNEERVSEKSLPDNPTRGDRLHVVAMGALTFASQQNHPVDPTEFNGFMQSFARELNAQELVNITPSNERERYSNGEKLLYVKYGDGEPRVEFGFIEKQGGWVLIKAWLGDREWNPLTGFSK